MIRTPDLDRSVPLAQRRERVVAKVASLARAGATVVHTDDTPQHDHYSVLLQDPEGNEFCVV
jgi:Glyoxalase-like domain